MISVLLHNVTERNIASLAFSQPPTMHRWRCWHPRHCGFNNSLRRVFTTSHAVDSVHVRCGASGHVTIDLHNFSHLKHDEPILIHLPPLPVNLGTKSKLPRFLQGLPVASIRFRWDRLSGTAQPALLDNGSSTQPSARWPTPVHDTAFAFSWLRDNFTPEKQGRRSVYVYGSFVGASLATSLALTEAHPHSRFAVRGLMAYNGIYNWTMFLPDHRINRPTTRAGRNVMSPLAKAGSQLHFLQEQMAGLFGHPTHLFDAFASPTLFFHSPGLIVPQSFTMSVAETAAIDAMVGKESDPTCQVKTPRKSHFIFPPRQSTLKIPEALLLHDSSPMPLTASGKPSRRKSKAIGNSFKTQATELAELMRRSIEVVELKDRCKWDDEILELADQSHKRVQLMDVGEGTSDYEMSAAGEAAALQWLSERELVGDR